VSAGHVRIENGAMKSSRITLTDLGRTQLMRDGCNGGPRLGVVPRRSMRMRSSPRANRREQNLPEHMRRIRTVLLAVALGLGLGACSKCDVPVWMPSSCHAGPGPGNA
jgi:hypothetical protein